MVESITEIKKSLGAAFADAAEDYVSLVTLIDMYEEDVLNRESLQEREEFLEVLLELLQKNPHVVAKIGWDLPQGLLKFFTVKNICIYQALSKSRVLTFVMKCFNEIAINGEAKECLLSGCELLGALRVHQDDTNEEEITEILSLQMSKLSMVDPSFAGRQPDQVLFGLKLHVLFELVGMALRRIRSAYLSKYLGVAVIAIKKLTVQNIRDVEDVSIILRRIYTFCRGYMPLEDGDEKEGVLQGKLLKNLLTFSLQNVLSNVPLYVDMMYYHETLSAAKKLPLTAYTKTLLELSVRYYQLSLTFDIDLVESFRQFVKESRELYSQEGKELYKASAKRRANQLSRLGIDEYGVLILSGIYYMEENQKNLVDDVSVADAICMYLRVSTPSVVSPMYYNGACESVAKYWLWVAICGKGAVVKDELPTSVVKLFLQVLFMKSVNESPNSELRMVNFTLATRVMCALPQTAVYEFMIELLASRDNDLARAKMCVLEILKDMASRGDSPDHFYLVLTDERKRAIHAAALAAAAAITDDNEADPLLLLLLWAQYLRFFAKLHQQWDAQLLAAVLAATPARPAADVDDAWAAVVAAEQQLRAAITNHEDSSSSS